MHRVYMRLFIVQRIMPVYSMGAKKKNSRHNSQALYEHTDSLYIVVAVSFHCGFDTENGDPQSSCSCYAAAQVL